MLSMQVVTDSRSAEGRGLMVAKSAKNAVDQLRARFFASAIADATWDMSRIESARAQIAMAERQALALPIIFWVAGALLIFVSVDELVKLGMIEEATVMAALLVAWLILITPTLVRASFQHAGRAWLKPWRPEADPEREMARISQLASRDPRIAEYLQRASVRQGGLLVFDRDAIEYATTRAGSSTGECANEGGSKTSRKPLA
jgi:hypothetical protein